MKYITLSFIYFFVSTDFLKCFYSNVFYLLSAQKITALWAVFYTGGLSRVRTVGGQGRFDGFANIQNSL